MLSLFYYLVISIAYINTFTFCILNTFIKNILKLIFFLLQL